MDYQSLLMILFLRGCLLAPMDDPIRIDLPVYDQPQVNVEETLSIQHKTDTNDQPQPSSEVHLVQGILAENHPGGEPDNNAGSNFISYKVQEADNFIGNTFDSKAAYLGPFAPPVTKIESAVQETEGLGSRAISIKDNFHSFVAGILQPKPIVDTISESEKYGNMGDKFYAAGQVLVRGASNVSNIVNTILEIPGTIIKNVARSTTEKLNNLGGKLIGL